MKTLKLTMGLIAVLLAAGCASSDPWTKQDTVLQSLVTTTFVLDAIQTSEIQYHDNIYENGPVAKHVLGRQPSTSDTWQYFTTVAIGHYLISRALPKRWRPYWQGAAIAYEGRLIFSNCALGLGRICKEGE